jgi:hypothetical protein
MNGGQSPHQNQQIATGPIESPMRTVAGALLVIILLAPIPSFRTSASDWPGPTSPHVEWSMNITVPSAWANPESNFTDLNGDGVDEMMIHWGNNYTFFDTRSYNILLSLNDSTIHDVEFIRIGNATAMDILVTYNTSYHFNISVISGKDFKETWRSPNINSTYWGNDIRDIDADGQLELVYAVWDWNATCFYVFDAISHALEWSSPRIYNEQPFLIRWLQNLDKDPALELLTSGDTPNYWGANPISAFDGATHEKLWAISMPDPYFFVSPYAHFSDIDNDSEIELVLPYYSRGEPSLATCGLNIYSANNGSLEWSLEPRPGGLLIKTMVDLNGDGWKEFMMESTSMNPDTSWNETLSIFSLKENRTLWTTGPFVKKNNETLGLESKDLDRDGAPEIIYSRSMSHGDNGSTVVFQVLRGTDFSVKWTSGEIWRYGNFLTTYQPSDGSPPRILLDYRNGPDPESQNFTLEIISTKDFQVLFNGSYDHGIEAWAEDWDGDLTLELLVLSSRYELFDGNGLQRLWNMTPEGYWLPNGMLAADLCGGPSFEFLKTTGYVEQRRYNVSGIRSWDVSVISIHDSRTFDGIWTSQRLDGDYMNKYLGDIDNDSNKEALYEIIQPGDNQLSLAIIEFPMDKPWTPGIDMRPPTVTIEKPRNGQIVSGNIRISGSAQDDNFLAQVMVRIDDGQWVNTSWIPGQGNLTCSWNHSWDSSQVTKGTHRISARAFDGASWSPEVSVTVRVRPPGTTTPALPAPTIGIFPDLACIGIIAAFLIIAVAAMIIRQRKE